ncbi:MAG TPA: hypothetical protein VK463_08550 [Desulfomonilaceae bacterium]|nr:hypothetical protein [Desulfomonilaceae bacterium]
MRTFGVILMIFLVVVFVGGAIPLGKASLFERIDAAVGSDSLMTLHYRVFFFLYKGDREVNKTGEQLKVFQDKPIGIDNKGKYRQLDDASKY